jgi:alpha-mannosidase
MLTDSKIFGKLEQIENRYDALRYETLAAVPMHYMETCEYLRAEPADANWQPAPIGTRWGGDWVTAWFRGDITLPSEVEGRPVFVRARTSGETLFLVDGVHSGVFDPNHPVVLMTSNADPAHTYHLAFEAYSGHSIPGTQPQDHPSPQGDKPKTFNGVEVVLELADTSAFVFDLRTLRQLMLSLDENSLRRNTIARQLGKVFACVDAMPQERDESSWRPKLAEARTLMQPLLQAVNGPTMPTMGIIGHSHIDTAWLWPLAETWRKCARTFSSMLNLMEQYPELLFIQSQPCQTEVMRDEYPDIYRRMQQMVAAGRWEPNGGMWVEPDCNVPSGESFVRQLLVGQHATREFFGYTSDTLWLPDVFGYSAALPQILRGCDVQFFCTTKINWNDTTRFPYDTFIWKGIDGTSVIAHYNAIHCWPDPATLIQQWNWVQHKDIQDRRLCSFGFGDGGGGPMAEMAEVARRVHDLEGCPRAEYTTVSRFMQGIRDELTDLPTWNGELYLELHRGTL